jgi:hypothetical protein
MAGFSGAERGGGGLGAVAEALVAGVDLFLVARGASLAETVHADLVDAAARHEDVRRRLLGAANRVDCLVAATRPDVSGTLEAVVRETGEVLGRAHERVTAIRLPAGGRRSPARPPRAGVVASAGIAWAFLRNEAITRSFGCTAEDIGRYGAEGIDPAWLDPRRTLVHLLFARGRRISPGDLVTIERIETWRRRGPEERAAIAVSLADPEILDHVPAAWGKVAGTGSHASALAAAAGKMGWGGTGRSA